MSATEKLSTGTALYYPYIHPREINHLKAALVYWDRVRRIVPRPLDAGKYVFDDDDAARMLADNELLLATKPEPYEAEATRKFFEHVEPQSDKFRIDLEAARGLARRNRGIHVEKIGGLAIDRLRDLGLAHRFGDWVYMHDEVGAFYMFCLASEMSRQIGAPLFSDHQEDAALGQSLLFEPDSSADVSEVLLRVGVKLPSPEALQDVPLRDVVNFAVKRADERRRFREAVEGIVKTARSAENQTAIEDYLATQRAAIESAVNDHRQALDELRVGVVASFAKITVPAAVASAVTALSLSEFVAAVFAGVGIAWSAIACIAETRGKLRQARTSTPYHYLTSIETAFGVDAVAKG